MYPKIRLILNISYKRWNEEGGDKENLKLLSTYMCQTLEQFLKCVSDILLFFFSFFVFLLPWEILFYLFILYCGIAD